MKIQSFVLLVIVLLGSSHGFLSVITDLGSSVADTIGSLVGTTTDWVKLPTPEEVFETGKNSLAGYPFEVVSSAVNEICSNMVNSKFMTERETPDIEKMHFQLRTACENYSVPFLKAEQLWQSPDFDRKKKVVILASGWMNTINESSVIMALSKAYNCRGDVNFVAVDAGQFVDTLYSWSALNTDAIGVFLAEGLVKLSKVVPVENIHLIGHSLGAHIMGTAARQFNYETGKLIPRVTGLDPAKPCFNKGERLSGLMRGDAVFVDVIHSNPGVLGKRDPVGDADFYPGGLNPLPSGCFTLVCAHDRAWKYYEETVYPGNERNFRGVRCGSMADLRAGKCTGNKYAMGCAVEHTLKGNYFLEINSEPPYGIDAKYEDHYLTNKCGLCPSNDEKRAR